MTKFITRAYNTFKINSDNGSTITKFSKETRLRDEIEYYKNLPSELSIFFPRLISSTNKESDYSLELEYYAYSNLGIKLINDPNDSTFWNSVYNFIFKYFLIRQKFTEVSNKTNASRMFIEKTQSEYQSLIDKFDFFENLCKYDTLTLTDSTNKTLYLKPFSVIWPKIKSYIENFIINRSDLYTIIHGDLCFSNILYGINPINNDIILKFIDPRGSFGNNPLYGDTYYDLAKISHSCNGKYEYIINDEFSIDSENNNFSLLYRNKIENSTKILVSSLFENISKLNGYNMDYIKLIEGTIFIGMCARHYDSLNRQKAMFITGLKYLNEIYEKL